jgi:hypothetical protein
LGNRFSFVLKVFQLEICHQLNLAHSHRTKKPNEPMSETQRDPIVERVINKFRQRSEAGVKKYGTTLADNHGLQVTDWIVHAQEELMDAILYLEKLKEETAL